MIATTHLEAVMSVELGTREKAILCGLYLSKFDREGAKRMGFQTLDEAFNVLGAAIGAKPKTVKIYRDEFDPVFSNPRKGWWKRPMTQPCKEVYERFKDCDIEELFSIIAGFAGQELKSK